MTPAQVGRALCDAMFVGDLRSNERTRATPTIPHAIRRKAFIQFHHGCAVPGCRSARNLDVHHIVPRSQGGTNDLWNLVVLCSGHHMRHHDDLLHIGGLAPHGLVFRFANDDLEDELEREGEQVSSERARRAPSDREGAERGKTTSTRGGGAEHRGSHSRGDDEGALVPRGTAARQGTSSGAARPSRMAAEARVSDGTGT
jgi:hypothetical protein